ncbi:MAG: hypothetical protein WC822_01440 [Candidatus Paceibacterota bacterium]|jgi:hypothetical protein
MNKDGKKKGDSYVAEMTRYVPHMDTPAVMFAFAAAARYFGLYSKSISISDVARALFGKYVNREDAENNLVWEP